MIYLAPLQGFTDFVYRKVYAEFFQGIDAFFIPYITVQNEGVLKKYEREILPQNNLQSRVVPQILCKDEDEACFLAETLLNHGYSEINLNMGCPYPMVTKRGRGAGLLPDPEQVYRILNTYFQRFDTALSVKLRAGLEAPEEIERIVPVLNEFPLKEVILHPRIARQLYKGETIDTAVDFALENLRHPLAYNGDIFTLEDFHRREKQFASVGNWMLGRGVLMNAFLPSAIKGIQLTGEAKRAALVLFHQKMVTEYEATTDNPGNALNKMQQFWIYFSYHFTTQAKAFKRIKKSKNLALFKAEAGSILNNEALFSGNNTLN
ncbi:tRNA-dihydrouridine synthase family protein [Maribellus luteus]|uniref:tRNA-dihydrouridine synthase n=1 Tax=Maribellus luteus TaxID=2305463 RepID=A0A399T0K5_9BACT|nr:tRNA-dihydrouridine synthase family protein [Maribellus luteus]RIJ49846.1 tRNA-dihydrouridine synthase family protein [Maribellus luteus]